MLNKLVYNPKEASQILGISHSTIRKAIASKRLKTFRVGSRIKINAKELEKLSHGEKVYTVKEVAEALDVAIITIRKLIATGELKAFRMVPRGAFRISQEELNRFIEGGEQ